MRTELFWLLSFGGFAAMSLLCGILVWPQLVAAWPSIEEAIDRFRRLPPLAKLVLMLFVGAFVVYGSTKTNLVDQTSGTNMVEIVEGGTNDVDVVEGGTNDVIIVEGGTNDVGEIDFEGGTNEVEIADGDTTNTPPMMLMMAMPFFGDQPPTVTPEDIARGWQLWEVHTNADISYTMPEGAALATNWWVRGAYEDVDLVNLGGAYGVRPQPWRFPFGTNEYSSFWAFSWGKVRFALGDTNAEIVAVGAPMSAVPYRSRLWSAADANGANVVTWENFVLGRERLSAPAGESAGGTVNAQIELRSTGDFITRSNEVETVYRRVDPDDWDDDGWRNDDDPDPYVWEEFWDDFYQELPEGDFACNYCWVEIRPQWNSWIVFEGDGPSNLDDPCFWAKAGETYRVQLLIGKTYDVMSTQPLSVVGRSNEAIQVSESGSCSFSVVWPVTFTVGEGRYAARPLLGATLNDGGRSFYVLRDPSFLRGTNVWWDGCCSISGDGTNFTFACDNTCTCEGCTTYGYFTYSGYTLDLPGWFECGCHYVPDEGPAEVSISFDRSAVIYEDAYTNQPGEVVHPARSNAVLRCSVSGGTYGGTFSVTLSDAAHQKLSMVRGDILPTNVRIDPGTSRSYEVVYSVLEPSSRVGDIQAAALFHEDFLNEVHSNGTSMTSVKVELEAVYEAPANPNPSRHIYGVGEKVRFEITPALSDVILTTRKLDEGDDDPDSEYELFGHSDRTDGGAVRVYTCPISANYHPPIEIALSDVTYHPDIKIVEPNTVITPSAGWGANITDMFYAGNRKCWPEGTVGAACLVTTNYIGPMYVSFQGIAVSELPCTEEDIVTGCFTNGHHRTHTGGPNGAGAGKAYYIQPGNFWFVDGARMTAPETNWVPDSTLSWKIPIGWHRKLGDSPNGYDAHFPDYEERFNGESRILMIGGRNDVYKQIWHIDGQGTCRTDKFGHWISRSRDCVIKLDGITIQTGHP